jgi:hypothetical protein
MNHAHRQGSTKTFAIFFQTVIKRLHHRPEENEGEKDMAQAWLVVTLSLGDAGRPRASRSLIPDRRTEWKGAAVRSQVVLLLRPVPPAVWQLASSPSAAHFADGGSFDGLTDLVPGLVGLVVSGMLVQPMPLRLQWRITNLRVALCQRPNECLIFIPFGYSQQRGAQL